MAMYKCDFGAVTAVGNKLISAASSFNSATNSYSGSIDSELSGWTGSAKDSFSSKKNELISNNTAAASYISEFGEFVISVAEKIQNLESELSSLSI